MKLLPSLLLLLPLSLHAANVQYSLTGPSGTAFAFVAPTFITNLPHETNQYGESVWHFVGPQLSVNPCVVSRVYHCGDIRLRFDPVLARIYVNAIEHDDFDDIDYDLFVNGFYNLNPGFTGAAYLNNYGSGAQMIIQLTDAPVTYAPEPSAWLLVAFGGVALAIKKAVRLTNRTTQSRKNIFRVACLGADVLQRQHDPNCYVLVSVRAACVAHLQDNRANCNLYRPTYRIQS
jgi:hypothetical protein